MDRNMDIDLRQNRTPPPTIGHGLGGGTRRSAVSEFPACACKALQQLEKTVNFAQYPPSTFSSPSQKAAAAANRMRDLQTCLDQDLFCLGPDRHTSRLNALQELRQVEMICSFFQEKSTLKDHYIYFDAIFCGREGESLPHEARISVLIKTCLLAVQYPDCGGLLTDVTTWLQKVGLMKPYGKQIVGMLVQEFCVDDSTALHPYLFPIIETSPTFAPYFFALSLGNFDLYEPIPTGLSEVVAQWLAEDPKPLIKPLTEQKAGNLILQKLVIQAIWKLESLSQGIIHKSRDAN